MGEIVKKIMGDFDKDPTYENLIIELNADGKVHIHTNMIRLDLTKDDYNQLYRAVTKAFHKLR